MYQNKTAARPLAAARARGAQLASCGRAPVAAPGAAATARPGPVPPARRPLPVPRGSALPHGTAPRPGPAMAHSAPLGLLEQGCPIQVEHDRKRRQFTVRLNGNGGGSGEQSPPRSHGSSPRCPQPPPPVPPGALLGTPQLLTAPPRRPRTPTSVPGPPPVPRPRCCVGERAPPAAPPTVSRRGAEVCAADTSLWPRHTFRPAVLRTESPGPHPCVPGCAF